MKRIIKNKEPQKLIEYKNKFSKEELENNDLYSDFPYKDKESCKTDEKNLRRILLEEQGYICCYCMSRINCDNSKIEHFKPQKKYRKLQLEYKNLFLACLGGKGKEQFCDTAKGDKELKKINLLENIENFIKYKKSNEGIIIYSDDKNIDEELNKILNLNASILKKNRKLKWKEVLNQLKKKEFDKNYIKKFLKSLKEKDKNGKYADFCEMVIFFLEKKIRGN